MPKVSHQEACAAVVCVCCVHEEQREFSSSRRRMRIVWRPTRTGSMFSWKYELEAGTEEDAAKVLLEHFGEGQGRAEHRVRTTTPSICLRTKRRNKKLQKRSACRISFHIRCMRSHKACKFRQGLPHFAHSGEWALVGAGTVDHGQRNIQQAQINRQLAAVVIPVVQHDRSQKADARHGR